MTDNEGFKLESAGGAQEFDADARRLALLVLPVAPTDWQSLSSTEAGQRWRELGAWVAWLRRQLVLDHRVVPPCWYQHAALVSVLSALHDHWRYAYDPLNSLLGPADWHRAFMQLEQRLRDWASRTGCAVSVHRPDVVVDYPEDNAEWTAHIVSDVAARVENEAAEAVGAGRG